MSQQTWHKTKKNLDILKGIVKNWEALTSDDFCDDEKMKVGDT